MLQQLERVGSVVAAPELWRTDLVASQHVGVFPDQGSNSCPPALAGGFLSIGWLLYAGLCARQC